MAKVAQVIHPKTKPLARHTPGIDNPVLKHWRDAVPNDRLAHLIKDATRVLLRSLQLRLVQHGVHLGHWTFLRVLWERDGLTQRELSLDAGVMEPTTVIALRAMESLGYVTREHRPDNRKNLYVCLTPKGRDLKQVLVPLAQEVNAVALTGLSDGDVAVVRRALLAMIGNLSQDPAITDGAKDA
ncbi:MAG: transcriptional regulator, MarR family [Polaromonas sp.]|nr:transcriptional regulator, MarR family [Polaromonas sp.]